jgi:hypothetical protein
VKSHEEISRICIDSGRPVETMTALARGIVDLAMHADLGINSGIHPSRRELDHAISRYRSVFRCLFGLDPAQPELGRRGEE